MNALHTLTAVIELGAGLALLCFPSATAALLVGAPLETAPALTVARVRGAGLGGLGVACWRPPAETQSRAADGSLAPRLIYKISAAGLPAFAGPGFGLYSMS